MFLLISKKVPADTLQPPAFILFALAHPERFASVRRLEKANPKILKLERRLIFDCWGNFPKEKERSLTVFDVQLMKRGQPSWIGELNVVVTEANNIG